MILNDYITEWSQQTPWLLDSQIEQDLIISRIIIELFNHPKLAESLAFRGGTALYKLFIQPAPRYSEDIDLVQVKAEPIGDTLSLIKEVLNPILGKPKWKLNQGRATLYYKYEPENYPEKITKIKIEINTREHFTVFGTFYKNFQMKSQWFSGQADIQTYQFNELIGTKLRALYQRKKRRDLFDLWIAQQQSEFDLAKVFHAFNQYMAFEDKYITRAMFEENLFYKLQQEIFTTDVSKILAEGYEWNVHRAAKEIQNTVIQKLPGEAWAGYKSNVEVEI